MLKLLFSWLQSPRGQWMISSYTVAKTFVPGWRIFHLSKYIFPCLSAPKFQQPALYLGLWQMCLVRNRKLCLTVFFFKDFLTSYSVLVLWAVPRLIFQQVELILTSKLFIPKQSCWQVQIQMAGMCCDLHVHISAFRKGMLLRCFASSAFLCRAMWRASLCDK